MTPGRKPSRDARMRAWEPWIIMYALPLSKVRKKRQIYTLAYAEQVGRCLSDEARRIILGLREK